MSLLHGKFVDSSFPLNGTKVKLDNDQNLVGKKVDGTDQAILKVNADDGIEFAAVPSVPADADPVGDNDLARKAYVDSAAAAAASALLPIDLASEVEGVLPAANGGSGRTDFPAMQMLFGAPDGLSIDRSEFLTYDASIGLMINQGGQQQMRSLAQEPTDPSAVLLNEKIEVLADPGDGASFTRMKHDYVEAKKSLTGKDLSASMGWDGTDSWVGVSETNIGTGTGGANVINMAKIFPTKAQLFTFDLGGSGPEPILPVEPYDLTTKAYVDNGLANKQDELGTGTTSQYLRGDLTWQTIATDPDVVYADDFASLPATGDADVLYGTKDDNKLWRWGQIGTPLVPDWTVGATGDFATLQDALADSNVVSGDVIGIEAGTYSVTSTLVISKEVKIVGAGIGQTILQTAGTSGDPVAMISVTANNVLLKDMTIKHRKTSNTSVEVAVSVSAGAFPTFTYVSGFIMDTCRVEYCEFGVVIRGNGFKLANNQIAYATGTTSNSNRAIGIYGSQGDCFIADNVFDNSSLNGTALRAIYSTSTNNTSNELCSGKLVMSGNSHLGLLQQFYLQDNVRGTNGDYDLYILDNVTNETSLFAGIFLATANQGDLFGQVIVEGNTISNNHETGTGFGKGLFAIDGAGSSLAYRSAPLPVHSADNELGQLVFRADYTEAINSSGAIVGYKNTVFTPVTVAFDAIIPAAPDAPATPGSYVAGYEIMSPTEVDDAIVDGVTARAPSQNAVYDALALKQDSLGTGTTSEYLRGDLTWQEVPQAAPKKETFTLSAEDITNEYVDCAFLAVADSMRLLSGGVEHMEGESYTLSTVDDVTRITFIGDLIVPSSSALVEGDKVYVQYLK